LRNLEVLFSENPNAKNYLKDEYFIFNKAMWRNYLGEVEGTHIFVADLFKTLCGKFCQNDASFMEDMTKTFWLAFYWNSKRSRFSSFTR